MTSLFTQCIINECREWNWPYYFREPKGWWESLTLGVNGSAPHDVYLYDQFEFKYMGIENEEEAKGIVPSGTSETTNLVADGMLF